MDMIWILKWPILTSPCTARQPGPWNNFQTSAIGNYEFRSMYNSMQIMPNKVKREKTTHRQQVVNLSVLIGSTGNFQFSRTSVWNWSGTWRWPQQICSLLLFPKQCSMSNPDSMLHQLVCKWCIYGPAVPESWNRNFNDLLLWHAAESGLDLLPAWLWYGSFAHITLRLCTFQRIQSSFFTINLCVLAVT